MALQRALIALFCSITTVLAAGPGFTVSGVPAQRPAAPKAPPHLKDYGNTEIWPLPASAIPAADATLDPSTFSFVLNPPTDPYLQEMTARAKDRILYFPNGTTAPGRQVLRSLDVTVTDDSIRQVQEGVDESYTISCASDGSAAFIVAPTIFGARHAVETFSQMVSADRLSGQYSVGCLNISEAPRFSHRGLLIDSARHWLNPNLLLAIMDGMSFNKMNALQASLAYLLHASVVSNLYPIVPQVGFGIDWSWVVPSLAFPNITELTSYGPAGTHVTTRETVAFLVQVRQETQALLASCVRHTLVPLL